MCDTHFAVVWVHNACHTAASTTDTRHIFPQGLLATNCITHKAKCVKMWSGLWPSGRAKPSGKVSLLITFKGALCIFEHVATITIGAHKISVVTQLRAINRWTESRSSIRHRLWVATLSCVLMNWPKMLLHNICGFSRKCKKVSQENEQKKNDSVSKPTKLLCNRFVSSEMSAGW